MITNLHAHILDSANRAPSPHNTQPWSLSLEENGLKVYIRQSRTLPAIDPKHNDILHAIGAMLENVILTLSYLGYESEYAVSEEISFENPIIYLKWKNIGKKLSDIDLYRMIPIRRTSRIAYDDRSIESMILQSVKKLVDAEHHLFIATDINQIKKIRNLVAEATVDQMEDALVSEELYQWMRFSKSNKRWYRDGLNAECMGWRRVEGLATGIVLNPKFLKLSSFLGLNKFIFSSADSVAPKCSAICLITIPEDNLRTRIEVGRDLQRVWLFLASKGLVTHPISAAVDVEQTRSKVMEILDVPLSHKHVNLFRIGYSSPVARSPRLPVDEILEG